MNFFQVTAIFNFFWVRIANLNQFWLGPLGTEIFCLLGMKIWPWNPFGREGEKLGRQVQNVCPLVQKRAEAAEPAKSCIEAKNQL